MRRVSGECAFKIVAYKYNPITKLWQKSFHEGIFSQVLFVLEKLLS